jgi:hypothetical protein
MDLCNFTSLFEIFCTIYLAYIITDNFTESSFIATITEKILRKYHNIDRLFHEIDSKILGAETSLNSLELPKSYSEDGKIKNDVEKTRALYDESVNIVKVQKRKITQSKKEIYSKIKGSYQTKAFSFLSLYLALYCIFILFFAGISATKDSRFDNSLLTWNIFTLFFLYAGWEYEVENSDASKKSNVNRLVCYCAKTFKINGFTFTLKAIMCGLILTVIGFFIPQKETEYYHHFHDFIIICTILIPILNFIIYFKKASNRAEKIRGNLTEKVQSIANDLPNELSEIEDLLTYFRIDTKIKIYEVPANGKME